MSDLGKALEPFIKSVVSDHVTGLNIEAMIAEKLEVIAQKASKIIEVKLQGKERMEKLPLVHKQFELLLQVAQLQGNNILLTGGAGLSKSTAVMQVAKALQLEFAQISFSNQTTKTDLLGFVDANGVYRGSGFEDAFRNGKVFLADEMDACSSNVLVLLNSAISNGIIQLPNGEQIEAHDNFRFIATANTNLRGSAQGFTARNKLDAATIDRFIVIDWELDLELEEKLTSNDGWLKIVRKCREVADRELEGVDITPRSSYDGASLLKLGISVENVIKMVIVKAMGEDEQKALLRVITENMKSQAVKDAGHKREVAKPKEAEPVDAPMPLEIIDDEDVKKAEYEW
jgi:MoxR-like ATPase